MAANDDTARLLVSIEATTAKFAKQLAGVAKSAGDTAGGIEKNFKKANDNVGRGFQDGGKKVVQSLGAQRAAVSNLSFQLNDIAMGLASGTSPFTIMVQQGSHVAQVFNGSGGGLVGAVKTLGGAFAQMVNPVSLASFAVIGLGGALVQYLTTLGSGVPDSEKYLKEHGDVIKSFETAWGVASDGVKQYSDAVRQVELQKLKDEFGSAQEAIKAAGESLSGEILGISIDEFGGATKSVADFRSALALLDKDIPDFRQFSIDMAKIEGMTGIPENIRELAKQLRLSANESLPLQEHLEAVSGHLNKIRLSGEEAKAALAALTSSAIGLGDSGGDAIGAVAGKIRTDLIPAMAQAITQVGEFIKNYSTLQEQVNKTSLGQLSPVFSGGGQFLNPDQLNTFRAGEEQYRAAGESAAAAMIRGFETFASKAYPDTRSSTGKFDAYRAGFGSDTVTRQNNVIEKVTKDTVVSLADAERDLSRRLIEFQSGIQSAIGVDTWKSLNDAQQAALSSIAYNYGSLPKSIVAAIEGGGGPEVVAKAIAALSANPGRRKEEAQAYLSGTGFSMGDAGLGSKKKSPTDIFKGDLEQVQKRIAVLNAEYAAQAQLNPLINDYGYAVEKARIQQELLSEAEKAGLEITPALKENIATLAENYARAASASDQLKESQKAAVESAQEFASLGKDVVGGFISDLRSGKSAAEAFAGALDRIADKLINLALDSLFSGFGGGGGGGLGGLLGGLFGFAEGGVAAHGRPQPMKTFARGGVSRSAAIFGEAGPEAAVPLPDGRNIPVRLMEPRIQRRSQSQQAVSVAVGVSVDDTGGLQAYVKSVSQQEVATAAPKIVSAANQQAPAAVARHQSTKGGASWR